MSADIVPVWAMAWLIAFSLLGSWVFGRFVLWAHPVVRGAGVIVSLLLGLVITSFIVNILTSEPPTIGTKLFAVVIPVLTVVMAGLVWRHRDEEPVRH